MIDAILFWNDVALEANRVSHTTGLDTNTLGPTMSSRALAIVHLAMYDAYAGAHGNPADLPAYRNGLPAPPASVSPQEAVAGAAHETMCKLFTHQKTAFDRFLNSVVAGETPSVSYGRAVATAILSDRNMDPDASNMGYAPSSNKGRHRPDPDNPTQGFHGPVYGKRSGLFAATDRHALDEPPKLTSNAYRKALQEVRAKGIAPELTGTLPKTAVFRSTEETVIGIYWGYDGASGLGTPPRMYNQIVRQVAMEQGNTEAENARLFALVNAAMGDAGILAWEQKYIHDFWRPVVGIREADPSMGPVGTGGSNINPNCDVNWLPLGAPSTNTAKKNFTPPFPAYPSGHATFGAAALHITRLFYGFSNYGDPDNLLGGKPFVSDEFNGMNTDNKGTVRPKHYRSFPGGLWQMILENGYSRVYLGVHWLFDAFGVDASGNPDFHSKIGGVPLGLKIAEDIFNGTRNAGLKKSNVGPASVV
jgi:vanadium chloroperoxidase